MTTSTSPWKAIVIYHKDCMDGFASAWAFNHKAAGEYDEVVYQPAGYGEHPLHWGLEFIGTDVYILDFSFSRDTLSAISALANYVLVLDHHKTAQAELEDWDDKPSNVEIRFDMTRSGCMLTWVHLYINHPPKLLVYVNDRDLWLFKEPLSKDINAVIAITPKDFNSYNVLAGAIENRFEQTAEIGSHLLYQHQDICEQIVRDARPISIVSDSGPVGNSYVGLACNCTPQFSSEVGNLLAKKSGSYGATYHSNARGEVKWSLRSIGDYDVSTIAKAFGGGGHRNAAGFTVNLNLEAGVDPSRIVLRSVA